MQNAQGLRPGDFLVFQIESGYALLRVLDVDVADEIWHLAAYRDFFLEVDAADAAVETPPNLKVELPHVALTDRAFESTQVARLRHMPLHESELSGYEDWKRSDDPVVHDRSIRLLLGLR